MTVKVKFGMGAFAAGMAASVMCLSACGDEVTEINQVTEKAELTGFESVDTFKDLGDCTEEKLVFVADSSALYFCHDEEWKKVSGQEVILGEKGDKGDKGADGAKGDKGDDGAKGDNGANGKSAYELAVAAGFTGTEAEWLASLKGAKGDDGSKGDDGADGKSAYELAVAAGFAGTEAEWLASLKGDKGDGGDKGEDGDKGNDGVGCSAAKTYNGVKVVCGADTVNVVLKEEMEYPLCGGIPFNPSTSFCDVRDSSLYYYVTIGNKKWMAEDLRYIDSVQTPSLQNNFWCKDSCETGGRYYKWAAAIDSIYTYENSDINCHDSVDCNLPETLRGICPRGWHLPTIEEWEGLFILIGGLENASWVLRERMECYGQWYGHGGIRGLNSFDFTADLGGHMEYMDYYGYEHVQNYGGMAEYWTASTPFQEADKGYGVQFSCERKDAVFTKYKKDIALPIRCARN